ncbi:MAG: L,D-transpeptidase [Clostridia bacterium]|nr:L,D-transpeptidase [Clostridia bacterium]
MAKRVLALLAAFAVVLTSSCLVFAEESSAKTEETVVLEEEESKEENENTSNEEKELPEEETEEEKKDEMLCDTFTLYVNVEKPEIENEIIIPSEMKIKLFSVEGELLGEESENITRDGWFAFEFSVPEYRIGTKFFAVAVEGTKSISYCEKEYGLHENFLAETFAYPDEEGKLVIYDEAYVSAKPLTGVDPWLEEAEKVVNDNKIKSDTPYLIWVSKSDFKVSVFLEREDGWECIKHFGCSIGAPDTPTITGQYKYIEQLKKWDYGTYYCGPIMRFYRGYAIHSTLLYNDGTDYDGRIGKMISHGCIRVRPENINWLMYYVPLNTKIYITN